MLPEPVFGSLRLFAAHKYKNNPPDLESQGVYFEVCDTYRTVCLKAFPRLEKVGRAILSMAAFRTTRPHHSSLITPQAVRNTARSNRGLSAANTSARALQVPNGAPVSLRTAAISMKCFLVIGKSYPFFFGMSRDFSGNVRKTSDPAEPSAYSPRIVRTPRIPSALSSAVLPIHSPYLSDSTTFIDRLDTLSSR
jgi:hypothetical protein